jgi:hypothetical protein
LVNSSSPQLVDLCTTQICTHTASVYACAIGAIGTRLTSKSSPHISLRNSLTYTSITCGCSRRTCSSILLHTRVREPRQRQLIGNSALALPVYINPRRFVPSESIECPCDNVTFQTRAHGLRECSRYAAHRYILQEISLEISLLDILGIEGIVALSSLQNPVPSPNQAAPAYPNLHLYMRKSQHHNSMIIAMSSHHELHHLSLGYTSPLQ